MTTDFRPFPKIARLAREVIITEKIDGTNAQVYIGEDGEFLAGSRTRWITPENDNYGFAAWAYSNKEELMQLGPGHHFGEWWGAGIQRKYNQTEKHWSLFNVERWCLHDQEPKVIRSSNPKEEPKYQKRLPACCGLVPMLSRVMLDTAYINGLMLMLRAGGSKAAPGFMNPEGVVIYHVPSGIMFKRTIEKDDEHKGQQ